MDGWEVALWAIACYVGVTALVRLMRRRRDALQQQFRDQLEAERKRRKQEEQRQADAQLYGE